MATAALVLMVLVCAALAVRARRLLTSALWLAGVSAVLALFLYRIGATYVGVIELSVGAGLVTVLMVFAINITGEEALDGKPVVPRPLAWALGLAPVLAIAALIFPLAASSASPVPGSFVIVMWHERGLDVVVQVVLIFAGVLGLLGLLAESEAPLRQPAAREVAARRDKELSAMEARAERQEVGS